MSPILLICLFFKLGHKKKNENKRQENDRFSDNYYALFYEKARAGKWSSGTASCSPSIPRGEKTGGFWK